MTSHDPRYREARNLTGFEVPNEVLDQLDDAWPGRTILAAQQKIPAEYQTLARGDLLDVVERDVRRNFSRELADAGRTLIVSSGIHWTQAEFHLGMAPEPPFGSSLAGVPWERGTPIEEWAYWIFCQVRGITVPTLVDDRLR